jgi:hypothetical protein
LCSNKVAGSFINEKLLIPYFLIINENLLNKMKVLAGRKVGMASSMRATCKKCTVSEICVSKKAISTFIMEEVTRGRKVRVMSIYIVAEGMLLLFKSYH